MRGSAVSQERERERSKKHANGEGDGGKAGFHPRGLASAGRAIAGPPRGLGAARSKGMLCVYGANRPSQLA